MLRDTQAYAFAPLRRELLMARYGNNAAGLFIFHVSAFSFISPFFAAPLIFATFACLFFAGELTRLCRAMPRLFL